MRIIPPTAEAPPQTRPVDGSRCTAAWGLGATGSDRKNSIAAALRALRVPFSASDVSPVAYTIRGVLDPRRTSRATEESLPPCMLACLQQCCAASIIGATCSGTVGGLPPLAIARARRTTKRQGWGGGGMALRPERDGGGKTTAGGGGSSDRKKRKTRGCRRWGCHERPRLAALNRERRRDKAGWPRSRWGTIQPGLDQSGESESASSNGARS